MVMLAALFIPFFILLVFAFIAFWIWMLVDCVNRNYKKENDKIVWVLVIVLAGIVGAIIYYFIVKKVLSDLFL